MQVVAGEEETEADEGEAKDVGGAEGNSMRKPRANQRHLCKNIKAKIVKQAARKLGRWMHLVCCKYSLLKLE